MVTHGTDTLEETAFLLDLTLETSKPVVFCGAMRTVSEAGWDGPANLLTAVRAAVHPDAAGRGVLIAVGEEIHSAAEASKWHTQSLDAFRSAHGPLGSLDRGQVAFDRPPFRRSVLAARRIVTDVDLHTMAAGVDDTLIRASIAGARAGSSSRPPAPGTSPPPCCPGSRPRWPPACRWSWCRAARRAASRPPTATRAGARCCASWA